MDAAVLGRKIRLTEICPSALWMSAPSAAKWLRSVTPDRAGKRPNGKASSRGSANIPSTRTVHKTAVGKGNIQPANKASNAIGATNDRRRLSTNFQRPTKGTPPRLNRLLPKIHGSNCQSPRTQRC